MSNTSPEDFEVSHVTQTIIQDAFNSGQFWERARSGEFIVRMGYDEHYTRRKARQRGFQYCTRSQMVYYFDFSNQLIAVAHQFRNPDGNLGASGKPDPKWLRVGHRILVYDASADYT